MWAAVRRALNGRSAGGDEDDQPQGDQSRADHATWTLRIAEMAPAHPRGEEYAGLS